MKKTEKRDAIVRAALESIAELGFHGAPVAMIATRAGVGAGTIYRYFANKDVLITELYREIEEKVHASLMRDFVPGQSVRERFLRFGKSLLQYFIENPLDFRYVEQFYNSPYGTALRKDRFSGKRDNRGVYHELFKEGVSRQEIKDLPQTVLFALAFGPVVTVVRDHILDFTRLDDTMIEKIIAACWDGIRR
jgi:TetR/AcrR family transcriptional regulator, repressor of fatR-cypB operon